MAIRLHLAELEHGRSDRQTEFINTNTFQATRFHSVKKNICISVKNIEGNFMQ